MMWPSARRGEIGRERLQHLRHGGCDADRAQRRSETYDVRRERRGCKRGRCQREEQHDQRAALHDVAQRHEQQDTGGIADLLRERDVADGAQTRVQVGRDHRQHGLQVVDVGDRDAARRREDEGGPAADPRFGRRHYFIALARAMKAAWSKSLPYAMNWFVVKFAAGTRVGAAPFS